MFDKINDPTAPTPERLREFVEMLQELSEGLGSTSVEGDEDHSEALLLRAANEIEDLARIAERLIYELKKYSPDADVIRRSSRYLTDHKLATSVSNCLRGNST